MLTRSVKLWVAASLISLLVYDAYVLRGSFAILFGYLAGVAQDVSYVSFTGGVFWLGFVGLGARFLAISLGLASIYVLWIKSKQFLQVKNMVAAALFLEGLNFLTLAASVWFLLNPQTPVFSPSLGVGYVLQIVFVVPFLWALSVKVGSYRSEAQKASLLKFAAFAFVSYVVALTANEMSRWASMISADTFQFIFQGIRAAGFLNAFAFMPFSIVFAVIATYRLYQLKMASAVKWVGASLIVIGLNYCVYVVYSYFADALNFLPLVDIWTLPLMGLGIALVSNAPKGQN